MADKTVLSFALRCLDAEGNETDGPGAALLGVDAEALRRALTLPAPEVTERERVAAVLGLATSAPDLAFVLALSQLLERSPPPAAPAPEAKPKKARRRERRSNAAEAVASEDALTTEERDAATIENPPVVAEDGKRTCGAFAEAGATGVPPLSDADVRWRVGMWLRSKAVRDEDTAEKIEAALRTNGWELKVAVAT